MKRILVICLLTLFVSTSVMAKAKDNTPPGDVEDLTAFMGKKVELEWTAVGDDGTVGKAGYYEIRCSDSKLFNFKEDWVKAKLCKKKKAREKSRKTEKVCIKKLKPGVTYYFALRAYDKAGNPSEVSNVSSSGIDKDKAAIYLKKANKIFYSQEKDYKTSVDYYLKALNSGSRVKNLDLMFKIAFCYKKTGNKKSQNYFDEHLRNQQYFYMIAGDPYGDKNFNLEKYNDFIAGLSFIGPAFTEPRTKNETVMYVPDKWVQKYKKQGIYFFLFYVVDYAYCYGDFPEYFVEQLQNELKVLEEGTSQLTPAYVYTAIAAHHVFNKRYEEALEYYMLAEAFEENEEEYANNLKQVIEKVQKQVK